MKGDQSTKLQEKIIFPSPQTYSVPAELVYNFIFTFCVLISNAKIKFL